MHALHKILAAHARPERASVTPGEFLEIEPDVFGVIVALNATEAKRLAADLEELGVDELPLKDRIYAVSDHAGPTPSIALAAAHQAWRSFFKSRGIRIFDAGAGISHLILPIGHEWPVTRFLTLIYASLPMKRQGFAL